MKRVGPDNLFLAEPQNHTRQQHAQGQRKVNGPLVFGGADGEHDAQRHRGHGTDDHYVNQNFERLRIRFPIGERARLVFRLDVQRRGGARIFLRGVHPPDFLQESLRLAIVLLPRGLQHKIKSRQQIQQQQRREKAAEKQVNAADELHLFNFPGQRNFDFLADQQPVGVQAGVGFEHLALGHNAEAFLFVSAVVGDDDGAEKFA